MQVTGDSYTYTWGITGLADYIPAWAQEGGREAMLERLRDPEQRRQIAKDFVTEEPYLANIGWHRVRLGVNDPEINGKLVEEVSEMREQPANGFGTLNIVSEHRECSQRRFPILQLRLFGNALPAYGTRYQRRSAGEHAVYGVDRQDIHPCRI